MIPKIIHYCWFGKNKKTKLMKKCIKSWKKFCPGYKIIEWNESNFDLENSCEYVKQAYKEKKWAFVSDYVRLKVVYDMGGIYLDTDVELIKNIDNFLENKSFFGYQDNLHLATGLGFGAEKYNSFLKIIMDDYEKCSFYKLNGELDLTPCTVRNTQAVTKYLNIINDTSIVNELPDVTLYPKEYFSPIDCKTYEMNITNNTVSIHWFAASWQDDEFLIVKEYHEFYDSISKLLPKKLTYFFVLMYYNVFRREKWIFLNKLWDSKK